MSQPATAYDDALLHAHRGELVVVVPLERDGHRGVHVHALRLYPWAELAIRHANADARAAAAIVTISRLLGDGLAP